MKLQRSECLIRTFTVLFQTCLHVLVLLATQNMNFILLRTETMETMSVFPWLRVAVYNENDRHAYCSSLRWYMGMENHDGMMSKGENSWSVHQSSLAVLPAEPSGSKSGGYGRRKYGFCLWNIYFILVEFFYMPLKSYNIGLYFPSEERCAADFYRP
jgi:hypothetical protein